MIVLLSCHCRANRRAVLNDDSNCLHYKAFLNNRNTGNRLSPHCTGSLGRTSQWSHKNDYRCDL
jgi:hypothetical protein